MYDYHMHTSFSRDASMELEEAIQRAIEVGLKEIVFTDHAELNVWSPEDLIIDDIFDEETYISTLQAVREKYKDQIQIKIGIEMGLQVEEKERIHQLIQRHPFDFVIGSSHTIDRVDLYYGKLFADRRKEETYERYFTEILRIVKEVDDFDVYGHLDLVRRYALSKYKEIELNSKDYEIIEEILKVLIGKGKGIEVNTSGYRYGLNTVNPSPEVLKMYKQLGGEVITVGSDAHKKQDVGCYILETYQLLKEIGFKYITTFDQRKPHFVRI
ncbi:histidinol-phosphatase (PHP family) [Geosporobacter subterraneus DSM 17957]|uniref:Histidinol-phosphatase n=1 Tax=Geosporobacter subterraneus DSM 17957 TaxID=1121919 RepID=A0A1M6D5F8_9FIRM|nr:histidinol-phosphatase HisJ family protein [Geosporobacter subterraneus]SHI68361.1 histidinol-phosphatase (PHP family) [Geosporobacter subterraneus DSM 17957]